MNTRILPLVILFFISFSSYAAYLSGSENRPISHHIEISFDHVMSELEQTAASFETITVPESWPHIAFLSAPGLLFVGLYLTSKKTNL
jgi:hypothetical protein